MDIQGRRETRPDNRPARRAVSAVFAVHGAVSGTFATRIPWIKDHLHLGPTSLGLALVAPALGAVLTMPLAGRIVHRYGGRATLRVMLTLLCVALALPALSPDLPVLFLTLLILGATMATTDVVMNANGVEVERRQGHSIMSGLHGLWSVGALLSSAVGAIAAHENVDARIHLAVMAAILVGVATLISRSLLDLHPDPLDEPPARFTLPARNILTIGLVGFCSIFAEGAAANWSGVYLKDVAHASAGVAASSYTAFACTMAALRLTGDMVVRRLGPVRTVRLAGCVAVTGGLLIVPAHSPLQAIAGFALLGAGIAVVIPLTFAAAGSRGGNTNQSIAGVATITYASDLIAPAIVGAVAGLTSLPVSFALITVLLAAMVTGAGALAPAA
jgi:MFS family permease